MSLFETKTVTGRIFPISTYSYCSPKHCFVITSSLIDIARSYGGERYEKRDLQIRVRKRFAELQALDEKQGRVLWHVVDASQSIEDVTKELIAIVNETVDKVNKESSPLKRMWEEGEYELPNLKDADVDEKKEGLN